MTARSNSNRPCFLRRLTPTLLLGLSSASPAIAQTATGDAELSDNLAAAIDAALDASNLSLVRQVGTPFEGIAAAWQAPNRGLDMESYFLADGVHIRPTGGGDRWSFELELAGLSRGARTSVVGDPEPVRHGDRIEYRHGEIVEWYLNRRDGLEQGFDVAERPLADQEGELALELDLGEGLRAAAVDADRVRLEGLGSDAAFSLSKLFTLDANGKALPSRFELRGEALTIVVDDSDATYPITVDPLVVNESAQLVVDGHVPGGLFGRSMDVSGLRAVVGAPGGSNHGGAAYVFFRGVNGWELESKIIDSLSQPQAGFGRSVALSGSNLAIGANGVDLYGVDAGAVVMYEHGANGWARGPVLKASSPEYWAGFGWDVELFGSKLFVGSPFRNEGGQDAGAVHVFEKSGSAWQETQLLSSPVASDSSNFGRGLALSNGVLAVAAPYHSWGLGSYGGVFLYSEDMNGTWQVDQNLGVFGAEEFGADMDFAGDRLAVGAPASDAGGDGRGAVYHFEEVGNSWQIVETLQGTVDQGGFGRAVALDGIPFSGMRLLIGEPGNHTAATRAGAAHVFLYDTNSGWALEDTLLPGSPESFGHFGEEIVLVGTSAFVASAANPAPAIASGKVELFQRSGSNWAADGVWESRDEDEDDYAGYSVAIDGLYAVVGVLGDDDTAVFGGAAYVFRNFGAAWALEARLSGGPDSSFQGRFGADVDIDGLRLVVGADREAASAVLRSGAAYVFERHAAGDWRLEERLEASIPREDARFGSSVAISGDSVLVGASSDQGSAPGTGAAYTFRFENDAWAFGQKLYAGGGVVNDDFGFCVAIDGDRLAVGAPRANPLGNDSGEVYFYRHDGSTWIAQSVASSSNDGAGARFGASLGLSNGLAAIGAPGDFDGEGRVHVYEDALVTWLHRTELAAIGALPGDLFGSSLDLDQGNLVVGAPDANVFGAYSGAAFAFQKSGSQWVETQLQPFTGSAGDGFGTSVGVSGERYLVGAPYRDLAFDDMGATYVFDLANLPSIVAFGLGDGSFGSCPCGNDSLPAEAAGCANSTGFGGHLDHSGSSSIAADDLVLEASQLPANKTCLLVSSFDQRSAGLPVGGGLLGLSAPISRLAFRTSSAAGTASWGSLNGLGELEEGDTRTYQVWYRDGGNGSCGTGSNLTNGLQVTFIE